MYSIWTRNRFETMGEMPILRRMHVISTTPITILVPIVALTRRVVSRVPAADLVGRVMGMVYWSRLSSMECDMAQRHLPRGLHGV